MIKNAKTTNTDRVELYTEAYASHFLKNKNKAIQAYIEAAKQAHTLEIGINAGHDLNLENILFFKKQIPNLKEVSIGHALICEALYDGLENVIAILFKKISMTLHTQINGQGQKLVILHGFLGMGDNWKSLSKKFGESGYEVHLPDMRNHGKSRTQLLTLIMTCYG